MNGEKGFNPENLSNQNSNTEIDARKNETDHIVQPEKKKESISFNALLRKLHRATSTIEDSIVDYFNVSDSELDDLVKGTQDGKEILLDINKHLQELLTNSIRGADKEYEHELPRVDPVRTAEKQKTELLRYKIQKAPSVYEKIKKDRLRGIYEVMEPEFEEVQKSDYKEQFFVQSFEADSGLVVNEMVSNRLSKSFNKAIAHLRVADPNSKKVLDLNFLLPKEVVFVPSQMLRRREEDKFINTSASDSQGEQPLDLRNYDGTQYDTVDHFAFVVRELISKKNEDLLETDQLVEYGDLSQPGALISLLHEIGHSWQNQYRKESGKYPYKYSLKMIKILLETYIRGVDKGDNELSELMAEELENHGVKVVPGDKERLKENQFIIKNFRIDFIMEEYEKEGVKFHKNSFVESSIKIESEILSKLMEGYVEEERNAWANAIKVLRTFRRNGIDLEPNLKTLDDFRKFLEPTLGSYDKSIYFEDDLVASKNSRKFMKKSSLKDNDPLGIRGN